MKMEYGKNIRVEKKPAQCPVCGSEKIATYLRGMPCYSKQLQNDIDEGRIILGGCCISEDDPFCVCTGCKTEFFELKH
jgi:hypothetical protein